MVTSGDRTHAQGYLNALNMLSGLRLCANVPGQYGVKPAVEGYACVVRVLCFPGWGDLGRVDFVGRFRTMATVSPPEF